MTDQSGAVVNSYAYDSYGTAQESVESLAQRFRYTGREFDADDLNVYRMTWNNPVNWVDPSGKSGLEYAGISASVVSALTNGQTAKELNLINGKSTASYLRQQRSNNLSTVAGTLNCVFHTLADLMRKAGSGEKVVGVNEDCGVDVEPLKPVLVGGLVDDLEGLLGSSPRYCRTPAGADQWIGSGWSVRFDIAPECHKGTGLTSISKIRASA